MPTANLINSLQTMYRSAKPPVAAETVTVSKLEPGQRVQGTLQEQVSPGLFKVQVAGQTLQMHLPGQLQNGSALELQVVSTTPRLTFSLVASTNPIAAGEHISASSRLIANIADLPLARTLVQSTAGRAVWPATGQPIDSKQLAASLRDALTHSGLFYESHQAQWVLGERSTAQLLVEPQNQWQDRDAQPKDLQNAALAASQPGKAAAESNFPVARELLPLVQQQLHTLETHQLTWSGLVWPGQQMQWEIQGEPEQRASPADERRWSTEMELALPRLGDVHARLVFSQGGVNLTLHAADADAIALFNRHLPGLHAAMNLAGIQLTAAVIEKS